MAMIHRCLLLSSISGVAAADIIIDWQSVTAESNGNFLLAVTAEHLTTEYSGEDRLSLTAEAKLKDGTDDGNMG
ncbi:hypothetical protein Dsin_009043 [Dipteronia sinensis]|uniref:Uncharacterized protein n=1 Tax=Dipteronia sinensis TaxID=43782 RepID=A0AAE0AQB6_9ROSI|nr:hypothetical protein Dsin_009043 [Dipteronia sinensis]